MAQRSEPAPDVLEPFYRRDPAADGQFYVGVLSTGIYCVCSCPARKPLRKNVAVFATTAEARAAGLRPCLRCHPDLVEKGRDPERESIEAVADRIRTEPAAFPDLDSLCRTSGWRPTRQNQLFRCHYHMAPSEFIARARAHWAAEQLLSSQRRTAAIALDAGYESSSVFHEGFRRWLGTTPGAWRKMDRERATEIRLPADFRREQALAYLGRDPESPAERLTPGARGPVFCKALAIDDRPITLELTFGRTAVHVRAIARGTIPLSVRARAHHVALGLLGLPFDPGPFERRASRTKAGRRLVRGGRGVRMGRTANLHEALTWAIVGQQVNLAFAHQCRRALIERYGARAPGGMKAHPTPNALADADTQDLRSMKLSGSKARYVIDTSRALAAGELDGIAEGSAQAAEKRLLALRGIGPWTANYARMRGLGLADCVPLGDAGLTAGLQRLFDLDERPDAERTATLLRPFAPYRTVACAHVWRHLS